MGLFAVRVIVFVLATSLGFMGFNLIFVAVVYGVILSTWFLDIVIGGTIWFSARGEMVAIQVLFIGALAVLALNSDGFAPQSMNLFLISPIILFALSSDAIANSRRWIVLVSALPFIGLLSMAVAGPFTHPSLKGGHLLQIPYAVYLYMSIGILAAAARLYFVRTRDLFHTSLDYPPIRVEILSWGMKKPMAFGFKYKSDSSLGLNEE